MPSNRTNLTNLAPNPSYLLLTIVFTVLSVIGLLMFFQINNLSPDRQAASTLTPVEEESILPDDPTSTPEEESRSPTLASAKTTLTPTVADTPTPTPLIQTYTSTEDKFSATYNSDRKVYQDKESTGRRYTFYRNTGNIALHVGTGWSWSHPGRTFTTDLEIDGKPTFRYDIQNQTIVDVEANDLKYTIQCLHGGTEGLKSECDEFISKFKFSP